MNDKYIKKQLKLGMQTAAAINILGNIKKTYEDNPEIYMPKKISQSNNNLAPIAAPARPKNKKKFVFALTSSITSFVLILTFGILIISGVLFPTPTPPNPPFDLAAAKALIAGDKIFLNWTGFIIDQRAIAVITTKDGSENGETTMFSYHKGNELENLEYYADIIWTNGVIIEEITNYVKNQTFYSGDKKGEVYWTSANPVEEIDYFMLNSNNCYLALDGTKFDAAVLGAEKISIAGGYKVILTVDINELAGLFCNVATFQAAGINNVVVNGTSTMTYYFDTNDKLVKLEINEEFSFKPFDDTTLSVKTTAVVENLSNTSIPVPKFI